AVRIRLVLAGVAALVVLAALHALVLLPAGASTSAILRARDFNFTAHFSYPLSAMVEDSVGEILGVPRAVVHIAGGWPLLGCLPALSWLLPAPRQAPGAALLSCGAVVAVAGALTIGHDFQGGPMSYRAV